MTAFSRTLWVVAWLPLLTGVLDLALGLASMRVLGASTRVLSLDDALLDSQIRFFGAVWLGLGATLLVSAADPRRYRNVLRATLGAIALGGVMRVVSIGLFGHPPLPLVLLTITEIVVGAGLLWWSVRVGAGA